MAERAGGDVGEGGVTPYVCPKCGYRVIRHTYFTGWEDEYIDPKTGDILSRVGGERDEVHTEDYFCPRYKCDWEGDKEWFDSIAEEQNEET